MPHHCTIQNNLYVIIIPIHHPVETQFPTQRESSSTIVLGENGAFDREAFISFQLLGNVDLSLKSVYSRVQIANLRVPGVYEFAVERAIL